MGFWDVAKELGGLAAEGAKNKVNRMVEYQEKYASWSDEELIRKVKHGSGDARLMAIRELKNRRYHASDLQ